MEDSPDHPWILTLFGWSLEYIDPEWVAEQRAREAEEAGQADLQERLQTEREENAPDAAVSGSVFDGNVLRIEGHTGTPDLTLTREFTVAWDLIGCDQQRVNLDVLFSKWERQYGNAAHSVVLYSHTGRRVGKFSALWGYHCG